MDDEDVVSHLQELGLTAYQSRAYVAAVRLGTARPNELASADGEFGVGGPKETGVDLVARGLELDRGAAE